MLNNSNPMKNFKNSIRPVISHKNNFLWKGPFEDGITFSLLSRFLVCRERFRIYITEGIKPIPSFNHRIEYGNMWHICEEAYAKKDNYKEKLRDYCNTLISKYPLERAQIENWYNICLIQFKVYTKHYLNKIEFELKQDKLNSIYEEKVFNNYYTLPSGRVVRLRGKFDKLLSNVDIDNIKPGPKNKIILQENKTKGEINLVEIIKQLSFDLQTMIYFISIDGFLNQEDINPKIFVKKDLLYNIIKRPLSGGKGTIRRHKATKSKQEEKEEDFYSRLEDIIKESYKDYFIRLKVSITCADVDYFKLKCLNPILEQLYDFWQSINGENVHVSSKEYQCYRMPYGVYNPLLEGGHTEIDNYLATKSMLGLYKVDNLFPELTEE